MATKYVRGALDAAPNIYNLAERTALRISSGEGLARDI